ncbi:MAG: T9SS type A sorting domain-containing protein [bacterium]|nr:MAG: T9SS type A sorting domain-containing protein [bacterium]
MTRLRFVILLILLVCGTAMLSQAAIDRDGGKRPLLGIPVDSNSTFEVGMLEGAFQTDTVAVPVYLHTTNQVTYIENRIYWVGADLDLVSVTKGTGLPSTASLAVYDVNDSTVRYEISDSVAFGIPTGEPIVYMNFEVGCIGWNTYTPIKFVDDDNYNFYVSGGQPRAPLREDGGIRTKHEYWCYLWGDIVWTYSGKQDTTMSFYLHQEVPGKFVTARIQYDSSILDIDSVTSGSDLPADIDVTYVGDTVIVDVIPPLPVLPPGTNEVFVVHFDLITGDDDLISLVNTTYGERLDECDVLRIPFCWPGQVRVPDHTAEVDIWEINCYNTASYYDVPFEMDSNFPVNDYELWVNFPADDLVYVSVVGVGGFIQPTADTIPGYPGILQINNGYNTNYHPWDLPAVVFKIRFAPIDSPPVGTVFDITFMQTSENEVRYDMDDPFGFHTADLTLLDGSITIIEYPGPGPEPGCPALYLWNGNAFVLENTILAACDGAVVEHDVTDFYLISKAVTLNAGMIPFQIREDGAEVSSFSDFQLLVVDHPENEPIQATRDGRIITIDQPFSISWAKDHKGKDITDVISAKDEVFYISEESGWFDVSFGKLNRNQINNFTATQSATKPKDEYDNKDSSASNSSGRNVSTKLTISVLTPDGSWRILSKEDARREPVRQATVIGPDLIDPDHELVLRYSWEGYYRLDVLEFNAARPFEGKPIMLGPAGVEHTEHGSVLHKLGAGGVTDPLTLSPGETIDLVFDARMLPPIAAGVKRDYIFVSTGRYEKETEEGTPRAHFALDANFPNPFNPATVICYNLAKATYVELSIYDVRGALIRTLVSGLQPAGEKRVTWDATSDSGQRVSSGVYFYRLRTPEFCQTRKMVLLQ